MTREAREALQISWDSFRLELKKRTCVMGIINRTPDSFSDGGNFLDLEIAASAALEMVHSGADIIDIGGESTRPGAFSVSADQEMDRVLPLIERLSKETEAIISIDTNKARVAEAALNCGASLINDITGLRGDPEMAGVVARHGVPVVIMHIKGTPSNMQNEPKYDNLIEEIIAYFNESIRIADSAGIDRDKIIIDPGIGFGKRLEHNLRILKELYRFKILGRPIMIGTSRKSFIGQILGAGVTGRLMGTAASTALAIANGANIIRVHDVKELTEVARVTDSICRA